MRLLFSVVLALVIFAGPGAHAQPDAAQPEGEGSRATQVAAAALDVLVLRPVGVAVVATGFVALAASTPLLAFFGGWEEAAEVFLYDPVAYTFQRPLGDF